MRAGWLVIVVFWAVRPSAAEACDCLPPPPPDEARVEAAAVFEGTATALTPLKTLEDGLVLSVAVAFKVTQAWKGVQGSEVTVETNGAESMCGYPFKPGGNYLVYAGRGEAGQLGTDLCSRTRRLQDATEDLVALNAAAR